MDKTLKCKKCFSPTELSVIFYSCNHRYCYQCLRHSVKIQQILNFDKHDIIDVNCICGKGTASCYYDGFYSSLSLPPVVMQSSSNKNGTINLYNSRIRARNKEIEKDVSSISKMIKDHIKEEITLTNNKIDYLILYLNDAKVVYQEKMEALNKRLLGLLQIIKSVMTESEYYCDINNASFNKVKENINFIPEVYKQSKEEKDSLLNYLLKEIKLMKSNNINETVFSADIEKVDAKAIEKVLQGHDNTIWTLVELPDSTLASGSYDSTICLWNILQQEPIQTLTGHKAKITSLCVLKDGMLASGSSDTTIILWMRKNTQYVHYHVLYGHSSSVNAIIQINPDQLISCSHEINIWDIKSSFSVIMLLETYKHPVTCLSYLNTGGFASGSYENIYLWSDNYQCQGIMKENGHYVTCVVHLNDYLASGAYDKTIRLWKNKQLAKTLKEHTSSIWTLFRISKVKFGSSSTNEIIIWDLNNFVSLVIINEKSYALIKLKSNNLAYGSYDNKIKVLNTEAYYE